MSYAGFLLFVKLCNFLPILFELFPNFLTLSLFAPLYSTKRETYTSLGSSNGCADQLTNWDGTMKLGLESVTKNLLKQLKLYGWSDLQQIVSVCHSQLLKCG